MQPNPHQPNLDADPQQPQRWVPVATSTDLVEGAGIERTVDGQLIALFRHQGRVFALEALCAHHGGPLADGRVADGCVTCPWHGWQYHLADGIHTTSGTQLIGSYPAREQEGRIEIRI